MLVVDLVSAPGTDPIDIQSVRIGSVVVRIPTRQHLLADKLCVLLSRSEVRDLQDARELLRVGADLEDALRRAGGLDGGFSPLTLAWVLRGLPVATLGPLAGLDPTACAELDAFRLELVERLAALGAIVPTPPPS